MSAFLKMIFGHKGRNGERAGSMKYEGRSKKCGGGVPPAPSCQTTKLPNYPTTKLSNHQTIKPSNRHQAAGSAEEVKMNAMHNALNAMQNAQCTMHNSGMKTGAQGRRKARLGWAAAVVIAAGVWVLGARDAWAYPDYLYAGNAPTPNTTSDNPSGHRYLDALNGDGSASYGISTIYAGDKVKVRAKLENDGYSQRIKVRYRTGSKPTSSAGTTLDMSWQTGNNGPAIWYSPNFGPWSANTVVHYVIWAEGWSDNPCYANGGKNGIKLENISDATDFYFTVQPVATPTSVDAAIKSGTSIEISWAKGDCGGNLKDTVVFRSSSPTPPTLSNGTRYSTTENTTVGSATVIYYGGGTSKVDEGLTLTAGTTYYYHVFAENYKYYSAAVTVSVTPTTGNTVYWNGSASSGDWVCSSSRTSSQYPWWYSDDLNFHWYNNALWGPNNIYIANNTETSQTLGNNNVHIASLTYLDDTGSSTALQSHTLASGGANYKLTVDGSIENSSSAAHEISAPIVLGANTTVNAASGLKFSGAISETSGSSKSLTKTGSGRLELSGNNSYAGGTAVNGGELVANHATAALGSGAVSVGSGATLTLSNNVTTVANDVTLGGGTLSANNTSSCAVSGDVTLTANSSIQNLKNSTVFTVSGDIDLASYTLTVTAAQNANRKVCLSGDISGTGQIAKSSGAGTLCLSGDNSGFSGSITFGSTKGVLELNNADALGGATINLTGVVLDNTSVADVTLNSGATLTIGSLSFTGTRALSFANIPATLGSTATLGITNTLTLGNISGNHPLTKTGPGTLEISGADSSTSATTVNEGTLLLSGSASSSAVTVGGGTLQPSGTDRQVKSLSMTSGILKVKPGVNTISAQSGAVSLTGGDVYFDTTGLDPADGPWVIAKGTSAATCTGVTLKNASGTALEAPWRLEASGNNVQVAYGTPRTVSVGDLVFTGASDSPQTLSVTFDPVAGSGGTKTYTPADSSIATVNSSGVVTPRAVGTTTIRVDVATDGTYAPVSGTCTVTVRAAKPTSQASVALYTGGADYRTATQFKIEVTRGNGNGVMVLAHAGDEPTDPTDGTKAARRVGDGSAKWSNYGDYGSDKVLLNTEDTSTDAKKRRTVTSASPATEYVLKAYEFNYKTSEGNVDAGTAALFSYMTPGGELSFWTLATEPTGVPSVTAPAGLQDSTTVPSTLDLTWTKGTWAAAAGESSSECRTLIILAGGSETVTPPTDGQVYALNSTALGGKVVYNDNGTTASLSLEFNTNYKLVLYSYAIGGDDSTANYYGTATTITFKTKVSHAPTHLWATGVDATGFLLNWNKPDNGDASTTYDVQAKVGAGAYADRMRVVFTNSFSTPEGWAADPDWATSADDKLVKVDNREWNFHTTANKKLRIYRTETSCSSDTGEIRLQENGQTMTLPVLYGPISRVTIKWKNIDSSYAAETLKLYKLTGSSFGTSTLLETWATTAKNEERTDTYDFDEPLTGPVRLRLENASGGTALKIMAIGVVEVYGPQRGYSDQVAAASGTYGLRVSQACEDDWSGDLSVIAAVVPGDPSETVGSRTTSSATFSWAKHASATGYRIDATTATTPGSMVTAETGGETEGIAWPKVCPTGDDSLSSSFSSTVHWKYIGGTASASSGSTSSVKEAPDYYTGTYQGHFLAGKPGLGIESEPFPIAGATNLTLSFTALAWNLKSSTGQRETGRVDGYYKLDDGEWCHLGSVIPSSTNDATFGKFSVSLPQGALDGTSIAFKIVAPNAEGDGTAFLRGPYIQALKVYCTAAGAGDYSQHVAGYPKTVAATGSGTMSETVSVGTAGTPVYFRVQALQGSDTEHPTAKSIWKEASGQTAEFGGGFDPTVTLLDPVAGQHQFTARWEEVDGADGYVVEVAACPGTAARRLVRECPDGTQAADITHANANNLFGATGWGWTTPANQTTWPDWRQDNAPTARGHALVVNNSSPGAETMPAVYSPTLDLREYGSGAVTFDHWTRRNDGATDEMLKRAEVTLRYMVSTDGTTWPSTWSTGDTTPKLPTHSRIVQETLSLPAAVLGQRYVKLKLSADSAEYTSSDNKAWGAMVKAIKVYGDAAQSAFAECGVGTSHSVSGGDTTTETVAGLTQETTYYYWVAAVKDGVRGPWTMGSVTTTALPEPTGVYEDPVGRYAFTAHWTASAGASGYVVELTTCDGGSGGDEVVEDGTCPNQGLATSGDDEWRYVRPAGSYYPKWTNGAVKTSTKGHNMLVGVSPADPSPAVASPDLDFSDYDGGYVEFSHWSRHGTLYVPDARVTIWYRTSADGSSWGAWQRGSETPDLTSASTIVTEQLPIPAGAAGQEHVQIKLSTEHSLPSGEGHASIVVGGDSTYTGPVIKDIKVHGTTKGAPIYDTARCSGASGPINVASGTSHEFTGLTAGEKYYYHVKAVDGAQSSGWVEREVSTLAPQTPPENISATAIKQKSMTLVWPEADGATEDTLYWVQASSCAGTEWSKTAVQPSSTTADLDDGDDWHYVGGGTEVTSSQQRDGHITGRGVYPAYAAGSEKSQVLAGAGTPGIESIAFSTVGASGGRLTFGHGRWYNASDLSTADLTASYSIDGGETWTVIGTSDGNDNAKEFVTDSGAEQRMDLPSGALGHSSVIVRIEATTAAVVSSVPVGAAVGSATVTLTGNPGNYTTDGCKILDVDGLSYDQLTQVLDGTTASAELRANTPYYFRVCASDGETDPAQYGAWVDGMAKTLDVPATPDTPWAVNIGRHTMTIRWNEAARAETYTLEVSTSSSFPAGSTTTYTGIAGTEQSVSGLEADTTYYFRVTGHSDGTDGSASSAGNAKTVTTMAITGLSVTNILETSLTVKWDTVDGDTYTLDWGPVSDEGAVGTAEEIPAPGSSLKRSDAGNGWSYFGGNGTYPAYWKGSTAGDEGHALIYATGGQPGIQSRWFSTFGVTNAVVDFYHGRFNVGADSTVVVTYSLDGGSTWSTAGTAESTGASTPTEHRQISLPAEALGKRSVMVRLTASGASGNKGAHVKDLKVVLQSGKGSAAETGVSVSGGTHTLSAPSKSIAAGTRYWFKLTATEGGETATAETTAATRTKTTGVLRSQGFEGTDAGSAGHYTHGALDTSAWGYTISYKNVSGGADAGSKTAGTQRPVVEVVSGQNPLYGDRALRMSGSANADVFGVVDFDNLNSSVLGSASANVTVTIPFAAQDLAQNDYLYVSYSTDNGSTWLAPGGTADQTSMGSVKMTRIGKGGGDVINRNWPYNRGTNSTTRPKGDAYTFDLTGISQLKLRVAFCGQTGGAARYYFIDEVTVSLNPSAPDPVRASANSSGNVDLTWTPATGQGAVIIRGQDMRNAPSFTDLASLPAGYEVVTNASGGVFFDNETTSWTDTGAISGNKYFYYFYGAVPASGGGYSLSKTPNQAETIIKGMVNAIASQGWDGWDVHPWGYRVGRVTNPGRSSDYGWWKSHGMNATTVDFVYDEYEVDMGGSTADGGFEHGSVHGATNTYASLYGKGAGASDTDKYKQLGVTSLKSYIGGHSFRLSGGGSFYWEGSHVWVDYNGNTKTNSNVDINTNNAAIEFANVDLSGYKNVEFQMHFAGQHLNGGNDLHVAISTNGGGAGTWLEVGNDNAAGWKVHESHYDYGRAISDGDTRLEGNWDFYFEDSASATPYGNPYVLQVPDSVTQIMVRVMFYDSNGGGRRDASYFIDEVRLVGEVALETPHPVMTDISKTSFTATWAPIEGATGYNVKVTSVEATDKVKLTEAFALEAVPLQWTASASYVDFSYSTASHSGKSGDYGLALTGENGWLASPEVGAANKVEFYVKPSSSSDMTLALEASADGETWELVKSFTASAVGTSWSKQTIELPRRQWERIRFRKSNSTAGNWYIDDITIYGGGNYTTTVTTRNELTATSLTVSSGVSANTEYFVSVQAYGAPNGVATVSGWGETADYTPGTFEVKSDGFEMTRSTWGASSSVPILLMAVNADHGYSEVTVPTGDPAIGATFGQGVVIAKDTANKTGAGFEHLVPYGARTDLRDQKFVAYWKHGDYWEGRLETNVVLGIYRSTAADAIAVTNGTADTAIGTYSAAEGKGWSGGWNLWDDANGNIDIVREGSWPYGLVGSNKLAGAGGNMIRFDMSNDTRRVRLHRSLATPADSGVVWMMVTLRSETGGTAETEDDGTTMKKMFGVQLTSISDPADAGNGIFASVGNLARRYSSKPMLQIDTSDNSSWPGGTAITWDNGGSGYELKDTHNQSGGAHTIVLKYDMTASPRTLSAAAIYTPNVQTIANNGALSPNSSAPTFNCTTTISGTPDLAGIVLMGKGYNGKLEFDEVRVGNSWGSLVGKEPVAPFPVSTATATMDGKEMIRLAWTKPAAATDTTVVPNVNRPAAEQVIVLEKNVNSAFTADQLAWKTHSQGESSTIGDAVVRVVYRGSGTEAEHVVLPGTSHRYAFYSYAEGVYAASALEVSTDPSSHPLTMDKYGETEYVNPFSYTNSFEVSGSGANTQWRGGNGFTNAGGNTVHFWATGDGENGTTANAGTWVPVKPASAPAKMGTEIPNYKASAGNVMKVSPAANTSASLGRTLAQDWGGEAGKTFFIAYRVSYTHAGINKWVGLKLIDNSGSHRGVFVGKPGTSDSTKQNMLSIDPGGGLGIGFGNYALNAGAGNAYVVVAKVQWTAADKVNVYAMAKYADGETEFPDEEPTTGWNAQWLNMTFSGVHMIELLAGGTGTDVTPGDTYFDEIRFGGSWDDLLGPKVPTDVWMAGLGHDTPVGAFLGDYVVNTITSEPQGPGQSAKHLLSSADNPRGTAWASAVEAAWKRNITDHTPPQTEWIATNQFKATGTLYAYGSATGDGETVYSQDHGSEDDAESLWYRKNTYTVAALPAPVLTATPDVGYKVPLSWTRGTSGGRTFEEVMIVRYADQASYDLIEANLYPEQGKAYYVGDTFSYAGNDARYATVIYRGTATGYTNRPCSNGTTYYYAAYTVNNNYYSPRAQAYARPSGDGGEITVDGDPTDWVGTPAEPWNSSIYSEGELIWTDKRGEERTDVPERCPSADITEFRVKADSTNVYFLLQLNGGRATMPTNAHVAVGLDTRLSTESTDMNWLADESYTFLGGAYYTNSPAFHYPKIQMAVHWVGGDRNEWQVELYDINSANWHAPVWWKASSKLDASGNPEASDTPCVEWVVPRSELGLAGVASDAAVTGRFSVATFLNSGSWNNEAVGVVRIASNGCAAVDALAIAPYGSNDKDYTLGAWDEGLKNNNVDFWMDARFGKDALLADTVPSTPGDPLPANDGTGSGNPTLQWSNSTDAEGFVTGWLLEVADTPNFGGDGGHTENGSVLYRVNVEMTPELAAAIAANPARKISFKPMTNCKEFWWRVRARDNAGQLSAATVQHYTVTGKQDNDGPVATLKYVGTQVEKFFTDGEYRAEVERNGEAYAIMDSEFGGNRSFGFVIEWYDINGVYATNHMRDRVPEYDGTIEENAPGTWPPWNPGVGDYTWNILATNSDGTAFGRVSPNWDLMMINTNTSGNTDSKYYDHQAGGIYYGKTITVTNGAGEKLSLQWMWTNSITLPTEIGDTVTTDGWVIQWGYDDPFKGVDEDDEFGGTGETLKAYDEGGRRTSCNGAQYLTNFVNGVFGLPEYDPDVDLYLTLSAEDCCTSDQWGEQPWEPWPPSSEREHQGSYRGLSAGEYPGQANANPLTGGWCADGPNPARNVTVNQLIKIHVKDNDVVPPIASTNRWAAGVDEDGTLFKPSLLISTNTITASSANTTWANITGKLPRREGLQRDVMYQLTDAMAAEHRPLTFFFNVYDDYIESGTQHGATETTRNPADTRSLTNSAFKVKTWDPEANSGAGAWVDSAPLLSGGDWSRVSENTANFSAAGSYLSDMVHDGTGWHEAAGTKGTGPSTVLRWDFAPTAEKYEQFLGSLFGKNDILSYIGTHSDGVTNLVQLHAWDSDDNRADDQAQAEITFGRLLFSDDDATSPEISRSNLLGTGTNMVKFGTLATDTFSRGAQPGGPGTAYEANQDFTGMSLGSAQVVQTGSVIVRSKDANGDPGAATLNFSSSANPGVAYMEKGMNGSSYTADSKYFEWVLGGNETAYWLADNLTFKSYVTKYGPTRYTLTVQGETGTAEHAPSSSEKWRVWTYDGTAYNEAELSSTSTTLRGRPASAGSVIYTAAVQTVSIPLDVITSGKIRFDVSLYGGNPARSPNRVLQLQYSLTDGLSWTTIETYNAQNDWAEGATATAISKNLDFPDALLGIQGNLLVRWYAPKDSTYVGVNGSHGFNLSNLKVTTVKGVAAETELGTIAVDKEEDGDGGYYDSTNQVSIVFSQSVEVTGTQKKTFRLYGWRATGNVAEDEADTTFTGGGNWGINNLELHGILSGPKGKEVTDHDLNQGAWTNTLEVQDGLLTGYDTVRSGLWVASNSADNCHAWVPDFTVYYPEASTKSGAEFWSSNLVELAYAEAELANGVNPDFADDDDGWTLAGDADVVAGTTTSGKWLLLPGDDSKAASASQTITVATPERGLEGVTVIVQARVRSVVAAGDAGAANGFTLGADFQTSAGASLSIGGTETFSATKAWHDYTLGPLSVMNSSVGQVAVSIAEETEAGTGLEVDSVLIAVSAFAPMVNEAPGTAKNGEMVSAQLKVRTQGLSAETLAKGMPLSAKSGSTQPANQHYTIVSRVYDYDHDRNGDARAATVTDAFWLYDNDEAAPQTGSQFGGPFGVKVNGTLLPTKQRINSGTASVWALSDHSIAEAAGSTSGSKLGFALDYYDFSGWRVTGLQFRKLNPATGAEAGTTTVLSGGTVSAAGTLASGYSRDAANTRDEGDANVPSATVGWEQAVMDFYALHATEFASDAIVTNAVWADVTDLDNDRVGDTLATGLAHVGNFRVMDQDVSAPHYRNASTSKFKGILVATNVADGATLQDLDSADYGHYALGGSLSAHNGALDDIATRAFTIYDGELREVSASKQFAVTADLVDPSDRTSGRSNTGLKRGTAATEGASSALAASITLTNTYLTWETAATNGTVVSNALAHYQSPASGWSSSDGQTKMAASVSFTTWTWDGFSFDDVGNLLPGGQDYRDLWLRIHAYDADADRQEDQKYAQLAGPKITVRDNDTKRPNPPAGVEVNGTLVPDETTIDRDTAPWTNNLSQVRVRFTAATDQEPTGFDTKKSGVARYQLAPEEATITQTSTNAGKRITTSVDGDKLKANLGAVTMDQGFGKYQLFAVDGDDDRPGDGLASTAADVPLAYDYTKPTPFEVYGASTETVDDPTTQMKLTWNSTDVGPDNNRKDTSGGEEYDDEGYEAIPAEVIRKATVDDKRQAYDILSPWETYKVYYRTYDGETAEAHPGYLTPELYVWKTLVEGETFEGEEWKSVTKDTPIADTTAATDYDGMGTAGTADVTLYDLDFDQHYLFVVVGVDKAGNEGLVTEDSWATNNTIKFAVTQGVVKATASIDTMVTAAGAGSQIQHPDLSETAPKRGAVLYWKASENKTTHAVNKEYDLIFRDATSFTEDGTERNWAMATSGSGDGMNSGTSQANWNYQTDTGLGSPRRLRFYRASYHNRWLDAVTNGAIVKEQTPLASEEVYSMNNIVLSEGWNYVSLQGVPYTNTFRAVFGTDPEIWPASGATAADPKGTARVEFYTSGTNAIIREWYYFGTSGANGAWYMGDTEPALDVTDLMPATNSAGARVWLRSETVGDTVTWYNAQTSEAVAVPLFDAGFFARPFGLVMPDCDESDDDNWWVTGNGIHADYEGAKASASKSVKAMLWHPILQVPTNGVSDGVFSQKIDGTANYYNLLSLNLPVAVHPSKLGLVTKDAEGNDTGFKTVSGDQSWLGDHLYVVDTETKEVRGESMLYCSAEEVVPETDEEEDDAVVPEAGEGEEPPPKEWKYTWKFVKNNRSVPNGFIKPNDMIVLISVGGEDWTWEYTPDQFYDLPTRHMGRDTLKEKLEAASGGGGGTESP